MYRQSAAARGDRILGQKKSHAGSITILVLSAAVLLGSVLLTDGPTRLLGALHSVRAPFLFAGMGCMAVYWGLESASLHLTAKKLYPPHRVRDSIVVSMIGQLFNCITPFASGGQPMQAYQLVKRGMPLGLASSALLVKSIVYQVVLSVYSLVTLFFRFGFFSREVAGFEPLVLIGFAVNSGVVVFLCAACRFPRAAQKTALCFVKLLDRFHLLRDAVQTKQNMQRGLTEFYQSFLFLRSSLPLLSALFVLTALQLTAFFTAPYFVCLALAPQRPDLFTVIAAGSFVLMISSFVPLPGASGGAEGAFFLFFRMFFGSALMTRTAILLWRVMTFYLPIAAGSCFTFFSSGVSPPSRPANSGRDDSSVILSQ